MKPQIALSPEQMHELQSLGLDCSDAGMVCINFNGTYAYVGGEETEAVKDCVNAHFDMEVTPAYTLEDILLKLPKYLYGEDGWKLVVTKNRVAYQDVDDATDFLYDCWGNTIMQNAFEMLKWVLQNHSDKIKKLER